MSDRVSISLDQHVADVMLNRPDKYNALDLKMFEALHKAARNLGDEPSLRAVVLHGAGENFCAGIDIGVFTDPDVKIDETLMAPMAGSDANLFQRAAYAWRELPVPVICALDGTCYGGGLQIALGADLRYATAATRFSIMETKWGLIPDMAISTTLRHIMRVDKVKELALSARIFDAAEALDLGLVTSIHDDPLEAARRFASDCASRSPEAIRSIKQLVNEAWNLPEAESLALEATLQGRIMGSSNQVEAVMANLQKRAPEFTD
ncbi:MAG: crotonase/enoyl-CoA hydratase family protein [Woeseiaceae bacterium]